MKQLLKGEPSRKRLPTPFLLPLAILGRARSLCRIDMALERLQSTSV